MSPCCLKPFSNYRNGDLPEGAGEEGRGEGAPRGLRRPQESPPQGAPAEAPCHSRSNARCDAPPTDSVQDAVEIIAIDVRNNDPRYENGRVEVRSPSHFRLDLSPNLNRPDHVYEPSEEPSTSTGSSSTAPTHWRFKMFKTGSKNSKQSYPRDGTVKNKNNSFEYDIPKISGKMSDKCFPSKAKNKMKISPIVNTCSEQIGSNGASPIGLNVCFGKKLLRSPSNSQTLEFNDRSAEGREEPGEESRVGGERESGRSAAAPRTHGSVYGRLGNTYGRLQVLGSGIGRIERHLSSSCGNIDHYCTPPLRSAEGNPRFRIENQSVEADRIYQHVENAVEEAPGAAPAAGAPGPPGIKGISKGSLQWLMVNRWLPLWVANTGGKNEYKVIDLDFSIYDDVRYPMCTAACTDEHCSGRSADAYSLYRRNCLAGGHLSLGRERDRWRDSDPQNYRNGPRDNGTSPGSSDHFVAEPFANDETIPIASGNAECDSPEPDSSAACSSGENYLMGQDSVGENDQDLSTGDNEPSVSECTAGEASSTSESSSPALDSSPLSQPALAPQTNHPA